MDSCRNNSLKRRAHPTAQLVFPQLDGLIDQVMALTTIAGCKSTRLPPVDAL